VPRAEVEKVRRILAAIKPEGPGLPAIVARHPSLKASYDLAPACTPPNASGAAPAASALPTPRDGTSIKACRDGQCEVRIDKKAEFTVNGLQILAGVTFSGVAFLTDLSLIHPDVGGSAGFGIAGGATTTFHVVAKTDTAAILDISTKR